MGGGRWGRGSLGAGRSPPPTSGDFGSSGNAPPTATYVFLFCPLSPPPTRKSYKYTWTTGTRQGDSSLPRVLNLLSGSRSPGLRDPGAAPGGSALVPSHPASQRLPPAHPQGRPQRHSKRHSAGKSDPSGGGGRTGRRCSATAVVQAVVQAVAVGAAPPASALGSRCSPSGGRAMHAVGPHLLPSGEGRGAWRTGRDRGELLACSATGSPLAHLGRLSRVRK